MELAPAMCPAMLSVDQKLSAPLPGWAEARMGFAHRLEGMTIYSGHPSTRASRVPDRTEGAGDHRQKDVWDVPTVKQSAWMECAYYSTDVTIRREVPNGASRCWAEFDTKMVLDGKPQLLRAGCD